jgi:hypothetical protein
LLCASSALCQGTTSVVPKDADEEVALAAEGRCQGLKPESNSAV